MFRCDEAAEITLFAISQINNEPSERSQPHQTRRVTQKSSRVVTAGRASALRAGKGEGSGRNYSEGSGVAGSEVSHGDSLGAASVGKFLELSFLFGRDVGHAQGTIAEDDAHGGRAMQRGAARAHRENIASGKTD